MYRQIFISLGDRRKRGGRGGGGGVGEEEGVGARKKNLREKGGPNKQGLCCCVSPAISLVYLHEREDVPLISMKVGMLESILSAAIFQQKIAFISFA